MKVYKVLHDGVQCAVEASSIESAVAAWRSHLNMGPGDDPDTIEIVSWEPVIRTEEAEAEAARRNDK